jgi:hypothetical protein
MLGRDILAEESKVQKGWMAARQLKPARAAIDFIGTTYCVLGETSLSHKLGSGYRGFRFFASFTDAQSVSVRALIGRTCAGDTGILRKFLPEFNRFLPSASDAACASFKSVSAHVNYRRNGKTDNGPAFDWPRII